MRVMCGVWLSLLASATALCFPAVLGHRSCVARVNLAQSHAWRSRWRSGNGVLAMANGDPDLLQALDAIEPTLSYQGWHKDVAEIEERYIQGRDPSEAFCELRRKQERHDAVLLWQQELGELKTTLNYEGWQDEAAEIEEKLGRDVVPRTYTPVWVMDQMRRKQQVHDRRLTCLKSRLKKKAAEAQAAAVRPPTKKKPKGSETQRPTKKNGLRGQTQGGR